MEFQLSYFKSWKMMLWKCCTQYASKFGKLSSGHSTGKGQFSFQSQRKAMPKNAQTTTQLYSSHTHYFASNAENSPRQASTVREPGTSRCSNWIEKRQRNQRSNCQHPLNHQKTKNSRKKSALLTMPNPLTVQITTNWKILQEMGKNWCLWTMVVLEKPLESPLDCKEIQTVHPTGNQSWIFIGRTDAEGETPILWPPDAKNWLIWKTLMQGMRRRGWQKMRLLDGITDSMDIYLSKLQELVRIGKPGILQSMGYKESDMTEQLNWTETSHSLSESHFPSLWNGNTESPLDIDEFPSKTAFLSPICSEVQHS